MAQEKSDSHRILVVDDNKDFAFSLSLLIHARGYEVLVAHDGRTGIELIEEFRPSAVFLDLAMPGMDGYEVARWIRGQTWGSQVCLIAISGRPLLEVSLALGSDELNFNFRFVKPVDPDILLSIIKASHSTASS